MNNKILKEAEANFLNKYPGGFNNSIIDSIAKKHKMKKLHEIAKESFALELFNDLENIDQLFNAYKKIISASTMVSIFEKAKFRDVAKEMNPIEKINLVNGLKDLLYGDEEKGFNTVYCVLEEYKLAKWPILTAIPLYFNPNKDVFIKPTTVKEVINYFELEGLKYSPKATYEFYCKYREAINDMKRQVHPSLSPDNGAFSGFIMMALQDK